MKLYHLDRAGTLCDHADILLKPISELDPDVRLSMLFERFPDGVSQHGINMTSRMAPFIHNPFGDQLLSADSFKGAFDQANSKIIDLTVELVRQAKFFHMPSRFQSLFAVEKLSDFFAWPGLINDLTPNSQIFELDVPDGTPRLDASFLSGGVVFNKDQNNNYYLGTFLTASYDMAVKYWSGESSDSPQYEYLVSLPLKAEAVHKLNFSPDDMEKLKHLICLSGIRPYYPST